MKILATYILALVLCLSSNVWGADEKAKDKQSRNTIQPTLVVTTLAVKEPDNKCWVTLHEKKDFGGESLTLWGPAALQDVEDQLGLDWVENFGSVQLSSNASLTTYKDEYFGDPETTYMGLADRDTKRGWFTEDVESLDLYCSLAE